MDSDKWGDHIRIRWDDNSVTNVDQIILDGYHWGFVADRARDRAARLDAMKADMVAKGLA
jgi:hypothetical protein